MAEPSIRNADQKPEQIGDVIQLVCFKLAGEEYGLDITAVQEVLRLQRITLVPQMPVFALGVVNIRGNVIPVFDLRKKFHLAEKAADKQTKIMIVTVDDTHISIVVDQVLDNIKLDATHIDPSPNVKMKMERDCIKGVGMFEDRIIILLDLAKVHEHLKRDIKEFQVSSEAVSPVLRSIS